MTFQVMLVGIYDERVRSFAIAVMTIREGRSRGPRSSPHIWEQGQLFQAAVHPVNLMDLELTSVEA